MNNFAEQALAATFAVNQTMVEESAARSAVAEVTDEPVTAARRNDTASIGPSTYEGPAPQPRDGAFVIPEQPHPG